MVLNARFVQKEKGFLNSKASLLISITKLENIAQNFTINHMQRECKIQCQGIWWEKNRTVSSRQKIVRARLGSGSLKKKKSSPHYPGLERDSRESEGEPEVAPVGGTGAEGRLCRGTSCPESMLMSRRARGSCVSQ